MAGLEGLESEFHAITNHQLRRARARARANYCSLSQPTAAVPGIQGSAGEPPSRFSPRKKTDLRLGGSQMRPMYTRYRT